MPDLYSERGVVQDNHFLLHGLVGEKACTMSQWKNGGLDDFTKKPLIVEIAMTNGKIFSIEYDAIPLMTVEGMRYRELGVLEWHPGF